MFLVYSIEKKTKTIYNFTKVGEDMKKGFTLIELLAVIIILSVIMSIAIPNIIATIDRNKKDAFIDDAKRMISAAEYKVRSDSSIEYPNTGGVTIIKLDKLGTSGLDRSPFDSVYSKSRSFVAIVNKVVDGKTERQYYAHLVTCEDNDCNNLSDDAITKVRGIFLANRDQLSTAGRLDLILKGSDVNYEKVDSDSIRIALHEQLHDYGIDIDVNSIKIY